MTPHKSAIKIGCGDTTAAVWPELRGTGGSRLSLADPPAHGRGDPTRKIAPPSGPAKLVRPASLPLGALERKARAMMNEV